VGRDEVRLDARIGNRQTGEGGDVGVGAAAGSLGWPPADRLPPVLPTTATFDVGRIASQTTLLPHRWVVERTCAWLGQYRRLTMPYERRVDIHQAFLTLGCVLICWNARQAHGGC
jgi:hypothetical protein